MYIWQDNQGFWWISARTDTEWHPSHLALSINHPFAYRHEAELALQAWRLDGGAEDYKWRKRA